MSVAESRTPTRPTRFPGTPPCCSHFESQALRTCALQRHAMLRLLAPMAQLDSKLERLLPQRPFGTLGELHNLGDRCFRLRVRAQLLHISLGVFAAYRLFRFSRLLSRLRCFLRHYCFLDL